jgi:hypothetical protein
LQHAYDLSPKWLSGFKSRRGWSKRDGGGNFLWPIAHCADLASYMVDVLLVSFRLEHCDDLLLPLHIAWTANRPCRKRRKWQSGVLKYGQHKTRASQSESAGANKKCGRLVERLRWVAKSMMPPLAFFRQTRRQMAAT